MSRRLAALVALVAVGGSAVVVSSGAYFTSALTTAAQTGTLTTLPSVADLTATKSGSPTGTTTTVAWTAPSLSAFTAAGATPTTTATVQRSSVNDFSSASSPVTLPTTNGTSVVDTTGGSSLSGSEVSAVGMSDDGAGVFAVIGGKVFGWGSHANTSWLTQVLTPTAVAGIPEEVTQVTVGLEHGCALTVTGRVFCFGNNGNGQLGNNSTTAAGGTAVEINAYTVFNNEPIIQITAGEYFTCALTSKGTIGCWGLNNYGQLGVAASTTQSLVPVKLTVPSGQTDVFATYKPIQVDAGPWGMCAIKGPSSSGTAPGNNEVVACWGRNNWNQLGNQTIRDVNPVPVNIQDNNTVLTGVTKVQVAHGVTCVLNDKTGTLANVACWGGGGLGLLGDGAASTYAYPTQLQTTETQTGFTNLTVGGDTACASRGNAYTCWGQNQSGQLGRGGSLGVNGFYKAGPMNTTPSSFGSDPIKAMASNHNTNCVVTVKKGMACWGNGSSGNLARGNTTSSSTPLPIQVNSLDVVPVDTPALTPIATQVAAGSDAYVTYAVVGGTVYYWGTTAETGSTLTTKTTATAVTGFPDGITQLVTGEQHACALVPSGTSKGIWCTGGNRYGQLGDGTTVDKLTSAVKVNDAVFAGKTIVKITAGRQFNCALTSDGTIGCWGLNSNFSFGLTTPASSSTPLIASPGSELSGASGKAVDIVAGSLHVCAARAGGGIACWGSGASNRLGAANSSGNDSATAIRVSDPSNFFGTTPVKMMAADWYNTCAISASAPNVGKVYCWGDNRWGVLGTGTKTDPSPAGVLTLASSGTYSGITVGTRLACGWRTDAIDCWGTNDNGWLGRGGSANSNALTAGAVVSPTMLGQGITSVSAGWVHACAVTAKGGLFCWGSGANYQTSQGNTTDQFNPIAVRTSSGVLSGGGTRYCLDGAALIDSNTCSLSPNRTYYYQMRYTVAGADNWLSPLQSVTR
ncbi:hypothetical protein DDQ50_00850 [Amnibacterium flavum]|uniref:RCC1-like domain-containing protein n=1 Tax=Amnibacterium flavum TaxID=2173173 RepID=A0A2V1HR80_9MICO|nr:hypothetical protein DDQ50_00850 [Amnibacterium flavum]